MKGLITKKTAGIVLISCLLFLVIFHLLILSGLITPDIVWGGQADESNVLFLEMFAIFLTLIFIVVGSVKSGFVKNNVLMKVSNLGIWVMVVYFSFNTIGNLMAKTFTEKLIFIPLSIIMLLCSIRLTMKK